MKTTLKNVKDIERVWHIVDAQNYVLGRLAAKIASVLRGKNKVHLSPHMDTGDFVVVINAEKIKVTGNKEDDKMYYTHSGYKGGIKGTRVKEMRERQPEKLIYKAVYGMLPDNRLRAGMIKRLKLFVGEAHTHDAQKPIPLSI